MDPYPASLSKYNWALVVGLGLVLLVVAVVPIWSVRIPPLVDYPNHLARMHVLSSGNESPLLRQYYEIRWAVLPNLAMDLVVPPLVGLVTVETAGKIFLSLVFCLLAGGVVALHRVLHHRWSLWPLLAVLFLYNSVFLWGFLNYLFGLGLSLWAFAAWLVWRNQPAVRLIPIFSFIAAALFFSHLFALGVYAIAVGAYELGGSWKMRRHIRDRVLPQLTTALAQFALPCILLMFSPLFASNDVPSWLKDSLHPYGVEFSGVGTVIDAFKGALRTEHVLTNRVTGVALCALLLFGVITKRLIIASSSLYWMLGALALATFLMPTNIGTGSYAEIRLPLALILYGMATLDLQLADRRWITAITVVFVGILLMRTTVITEHWLAADRQYDEFVHAVDGLPAGSRIFSAIRKNDFFRNEVHSRMPSPIPTENLVCWAVITKSAFVSIIFSAPNQQPMILAPPYPSFYSTGEYLAKNSVDWEAVDRQYQYLLVRRRDVFRPPIPESAIPIFSGTHFGLYRLPGATT